MRKEGREICHSRDIMKISRTGGYTEGPAGRTCVDGWPNRVRGRVVKRQTLFSAANDEKLG